MNNDRRRLWHTSHYVALPAVCIVFLFFSAGSKVQCRATALRHGEYLFRVSYGTTVVLLYSCTITITTTTTVCPFLDPASFASRTYGELSWCTINIKIVLIISTILVLYGVELYYTVWGIVGICFWLGSLCLPLRAVGWPSLCRR